MVFNSVISAKQEPSFDLLWQNTNAGVEFTPQTISLPTGYSAFIVEFKQNATWSHPNAMMYVPFSTASRTFDPFAETRDYDWTYRYGRWVESATDGSIRFGHGLWGRVTNTGLANNDSGAIPVAIYGLKFTI